MNELYISDKPIIFNIGCGNSRISETESFFKEWKEIRADLYMNDVDVKCDLVKMDMVPDESVDCVWASHVVEHQYWHELPQVFQNIMRIMKPNGFAVIKVPDIGSVADRIKNNLLDPIPDFYGLAPIDIIFGMRELTQADPLGQIHRTCFTPDSMSRILNSLGIKAFMSNVGYEITAVLFKEQVPESYLNYNGKQ